MSTQFTKGVQRSHLVRDILKSPVVGMKSTLVGWSTVTAKDTFLEISLRDTSAKIVFHVPLISVTKQDREILMQSNPESIISLTITIAALKSLDTFIVSVEDVKVLRPAHAGFSYDISDAMRITMHNLSEMLSCQQFNIRSLRIIKMMQVRAEVFRAIREFFYSRGFLEFQSPVIATATDPAVRTAQLFGVRYEGSITPYILSASAQLYKQAALSCADKVYTISPALRFEEYASKATGRHLLEFQELDIEVAFADYEDIVKIAEEMIVYIYQYIVTYCKEELEYFGVDSIISNIPYDRIPHAEAVKIAEKLGISTPKDDEISWEAEKAISSQLENPMWIYDYPIGPRGWYYRQDPANPKIVKSMDLLYPAGFGEGITGGEREFEYTHLIHRIEKHGDDPKRYEWYAEMFKFGLPPSAGFGLGIERFIRYVLNLEYIWEASMFPRVSGEIHDS